MSELQILYQKQKELIAEQCKLFTTLGRELDEIDRLKLKKQTEFFAKLNKNLNALGKITEQIKETIEWEL